VKRFATLIVVLKDGTMEAVRFRKLKFAREAAFNLNNGGSCRCAFALMRWGTPMPHIFDHTPTAQEVFDEACRFFATSPGPSTGTTLRMGTLHPDCMYRNPNGRCCVAGHFPAGRLL
jgi:hypothetical protein